MTAGTSALAAEMEGYIRQTQESRGAQITVLKQARAGMGLGMRTRQGVRWHAAGAGPGCAALRDRSPSLPPNSLPLPLTRTQSRATC